MFFVQCFLNAHKHSRTQLYGQGSSWSDKCNIPSLMRSNSNFKCYILKFYSEYLANPWVIIDNIGSDHHGPDSLIE
jgi:hypothetical protein